jgi:hypothetical protein
MNEHIEKLKQEAYVTKDGEFCFDGGKVEILDVNKFAELIIRECALVVFKKTGPKSALNILEHFGVEE